MTALDRVLTLHRMATVLRRRRTKRRRAYEPNSTDQY